MDDEADVKKIVEVLTVSKQEQIDGLPYEDSLIVNDDDYDEFDEGTSNLKESDVFSITEVPSTESHSKDSVSILTSNEKIVVDSCHDPDLKKLLILNRTKNMQLIQLYKQIKDLLIECKRNIAEKKLIKAQEEARKHQRYSSTGAWRLGAPYFKDKNLFPCPPNSDTVRKKENNELNTCDLSPLVKWSASDCKLLLDVVKLNYSLNKRTKLKRKLTEACNSKNKKELAKNSNETPDNSDDELPPLHSDTNINWARISDHFLKGKYSDTECRSFWHLYIHPSINKSPWSQEENNKLKQLVRKYNFQDWTSIVQELGTNRSILTSCVNYFSYLHDKYKKGEFTYAEDRKLVDLVRQYRMGTYIPWIKISEHFTDRTRHQIHHRYTCYLSQDHRKRGRFTDAEDLLLIICVDRFGKRFKKCREYLPHRQQVQLKSRYNTNLQHYLKKGSWSIEEDQMILDYVKQYGSKNWSSLSKQLKRSRGQIRQRYYVVYYHLHKVHNATIENIPRRKHFLKKEEEKFFVLRSIANEFKDKPIPTLQEIEKVLRDRSVMNSSSEEEDDDEEVCNNRNKSAIDSILENIESEAEEDSLKDEEEAHDDVYDKDIDHWLTDYFAQTNLEMPKKVITSHSIIEVVDSVEELLDALQVDLDVSDNFDMIPSLDNIDVAILMHLMKRYQRTENDIKPIEILPPNVYTARGLDNLLKKCSKNRRAHKSVLQFSQRHPNTRYPLKGEVESELLDLDPGKRVSMENERNLFFRRFHALFKLPALMSLDSPTEELESSTEYCCPKPVSGMRTYSKAKPIVEDQEPPSKKIKLTEIPPADNPNVLKLTPVTDKSVIENLLKDQSKKLFTFEKVQADGKVRAVIRQIKFPTGKSANEPSNSGASTSKAYSATVTSSANNQ